MKIHVISGFLGAGKTTLINRWLPALDGRVCIVENEFGDVSIDDRLFPTKLKIKEIHSGCVCCSLKGDLMQGIIEMYEKYSPEHLIIEPSGIASLSQVLKTCQKIVKKIDGEIGVICTLVDLTVFEDYIENFGYFYEDQIKSAPLVLFSNLEKVSKELIQRSLNKIRQLKPKLKIIANEWTGALAYEVDTYLSLGAFESEIYATRGNTIPVNQVLESVSITDPRKFSKDKFLSIFENLDELTQDRLLRAKGFIELDDSMKIHFNYTPNHMEWSYTKREASPGIVFIGSSLNEAKIKSTFNRSIELLNF